MAPPPGRRWSRARRCALATRRPRMRPQQARRREARVGSARRATARPRSRGTCRNARASMRAPAAPCRSPSPERPGRRPTAPIAARHRARARSARARGAAPIAPLAQRAREVASARRADARATPNLAPETEARRRGGGRRTEAHAAHRVGVRARDAERRARASVATMPAELRHGLARLRAPLRMCTSALAARRRRRRRACAVPPASARSAPRLHLCEAASSTAESESRSTARRLLYARRSSRRGLAAALHRTGRTRRRRRAQATSAAKRPGRGAAGDQAIVSRRQEGLARRRRCTRPSRRLYSAAKFVRRRTEALAPWRAAPGRARARTCAGRAVHVAEVAWSCAPRPRAARRGAPARRARAQRRPRAPPSLGRLGRAPAGARAGAPARRSRLVPPTTRASAPFTRRTAGRRRPCADTAGSDHAETRGVELNEDPRAGAHRGDGHVAPPATRRHALVQARLMPRLLDRGRLERALQAVDAGSNLDDATHVASRPSAESAGPRRGEDRPWPPRRAARRAAVASLLAAARSPRPALRRRSRGGECPCADACRSPACGVAGGDRQLAERAPSRGRGGLSRGYGPRVNRKAGGGRRRYWPGARPSERSLHEARGPRQKRVAFSIKLSRCGYVERTRAVLPPADCYRAVHLFEL